MFKVGKFIFSVLVALLIEVLLYFIIFKNFEVVDYAFMCAACLLFTFLLKLFNVEPAKGSLNMGRNATDAYTSLSLSFLEKHFDPKHRKRVSSADEDKRILLKYAVLIVINGIIVYILS